MHRGTSFEDALVVANDAADFAPGEYERRYVQDRYRPCIAGQRDEMRRHLVYDGQASLDHDGTAYVVVDAHCSDRSVAVKRYFRRGPAIPIRGE